MKMITNLRNLIFEINKYNHNYYKDLIVIVFYYGNNHRLCQWSEKSLSDESDKKTPFGVK